MYYINAFLSRCLQNKVCSGNLLLPYCFSKPSEKKKKFDSGFFFVQHLRTVSFDAKYVCKQFK